MWWLVGFVGVCCATWGFVSARRILYPESHDIVLPDPLPASTPCLLRADDGTPFEAWRLEAVSPRARLLMCHGYYANRFQVLAIADGLRQRGYEVLLMELRGHGQRPGPCTLGLQESRDAQTVLRWAAQRDAGRRVPIGALGLSMGAALVCQLAAQEPAVQAIVADSIYAQLLPVIQRVVRQRYHLPATPWTWLTWWSLQAMLGKRLAARDPLALAPTLHQPLFAIYGGADQRVEPSSTEAFYRAWAGPKERWFDPVAAHVGMFRAHPHEYGTRVADFFDRTLRS